MDGARGMNAIHEDPAYRALLAHSARIGADPALVQGAGGNTSLKRDGVLWVKASGTWLRDAERRAIMVPVRMAPLLTALASDDPRAETARDFVVAEDNPGGLRPSIETTMHAVLPHRVVVHVHCVETIAWALREDAAAALAAPLAGLPWAFVPYVRPGPPLTRAIRERLAPETDILVLGNHGLVVGAADPAAAVALVAMVAARLRLPPRAAPPADAPALARLAAGGAYIPAPPAVHAIATDPAALDVARRGSFYPDHVIFLGPSIRVVAPDQPLPAGDEAPPMLVVPGKGVLLRRDASPGVAPLARCLADVCARLDPALPLRPLLAEEESALLNWEAEQYRRVLAASGS